MGHIRKQGKNSYQVVVSKGKNPVTGKYEYIYKTVKGNKTEAKEVMHKLEYEVQNGSYIEPSKMTIAELLHKWYEDYCEVNLAETTQEYYDGLINGHMVPLLGNIKLSDLKPMHIQSYLSEKLKSGRMDGKKGGLSKKSVKRHYTVLNQALKYAVQLQILDSNPANPISPPSPDKPEIQAMSQEEVNKLLDEAKGWLYDFLYLAVFTGMRRGEILALRWQDVDLSEKKIHVKQSVSVLKGGKLVFKEPKTRGSIRPIDINDSIVKILKNRKLQEKKDRLRLADDYNNEYNLVLTKEAGEPYLPDHATKSFKRLARKLDLGKYRLHDLRHTHATLMLKAGVHPKIVQERLGHSSINQTLDTYSHVIPSMQKEAVEKLDNILKK